MRTTPRKNNCLICGQSARGKYCSLACYGKRPERFKKPLATCEQCGKEFHPRHRAAGDDANKCCSRECGWKYLSAKASLAGAQRARMVAEKRASLYIDGICEICEKPFHRLAKQVTNYKVCSPACREIKQNRVKRPLTVSARDCIECGATFTAIDVGSRKQMFCSTRCRIRIQKRERRCREHNSKSDKPMLKAIYEASSGRCYLCGLISPIFRGARDGRLRHMAVLDHVHPLCAHGQNTMDNVKLAHFGCNSVKGSSLPGEVSYWDRLVFRGRLMDWAFAVVRGEIEGVEYKTTPMTISV